MSVRSIQIYPADLATFDENWIFGHTKLPFWTHVALKRDMMWCEILRSSLFSAHCTSFMWRLPLLRRGGQHINICRYTYIYGGVSISAQFCSCTDSVPISYNLPPLPSPVCSSDISFVRMGGNLNSRPGWQLGYIKNVEPLLGMKYKRSLFYITPAQSKHFVKASISKALF